MNVQPQEKQVLNIILLFYCEIVCAKVQKISHIKR